MRCYVAVANAANSDASFWPAVATVANAHAVLARFCALKSTMLRFAALAKVVNSCVSSYPAVAKAHAELARSCVVKSAMRRSAAIANIMNTCVSCYPAVAKAHAVLASS